MIGVPFLSVKSKTLGLLGCSLKKVSWLFTVISTTRELTNFDAIFFNLSKSKFSSENSVAGIGYGGYTFQVGYLLMPSLEQRLD